jgi:hypothetical protein
MNQKQKLVLIILVPIIIFFIVLPIANSIGVTLHKVNLNKIYGVPGIKWGIHITHDPFDWGKTWYVWFLYITFCCIFEYKLFADKKKKDK